MKVGTPGAKIGLPAPTRVELPKMVTAEHDDDRVTPLDVHCEYEGVISPVFSVSTGDARAAARVKSLRADVETLIDENDELLRERKLILLLTLIGMALAAALGAVLT